MKKEYKDLSAEIEELIKEGKQQGYITYKDARRIFSDNVVWAPYLEELFARLEEENLPFAIDGTIETLKEETLEVKEKPKEEIPLKKEDLDALSLYLKDLKSIKLLSYEEERELARKMEWAKLKIKAEEIRAGASLKRLERLKRMVTHSDKEKSPLPDYMKQLNIDKIESTINKIKKLEAEVREVKRCLIEAHTFLVIGLAKQYVDRGKLSLEELIEEGNIGLVRAADKYDYTQGYRFASYALWWIKHAMLRAMTEKSALIRLPERKFQLLISIVKTSQILQNKLQREPSLAEIANYINVPVAKLVSLIYHVQPIISLEEEIEGKEGKFTVGELIEDEKAFLTQTAPFIRDLKEKLEEILKQLSPLEEEVITSRFGLRDGEPQTFSDIASKLKLSRERVRQITENALHKLRRIQITRDLLPFIKE